MLRDIPVTLPRTPLLSAVDQGGSLRTLNEAELAQLCEELRAYLLYSVAKAAATLAPASAW